MIGETLFGSSTYEKVHLSNQKLNNNKKEILSWGALLRKTGTEPMVLIYKI